MLFAIWKSCWRLNVRPPGVEDTWDECSAVTQAHMIAFSELIDYEEAENAVPWNF